MSEEKQETSQEYTKEERMVNILLHSTEGLLGTNGRNITMQHVDRYEAVTKEGVAGILCHWRAARKLPHSFIPMTNVRCINYEYIKVPVPIESEEAPKVAKKSKK